MCRRTRYVSATLALAGVLVLSAAAYGFVIQLGGSTGYRARIEVMQTAPNQLKILVTNLTTFGSSVPLPTGVSATCPYLVGSGLDAACRLLTSFGWTHNAIPQSITGGSAKIAAGSTGLGDKPAPNTTYPAGTDWSAEWGYGNNEPMDGTGKLDFISTNVSPHDAVRFRPQPRRASGA